jgi:hypothetical protein
LARGKTLFRSTNRILGLHVEFNLTAGAIPVVSASVAGIKSAINKSPGFLVVIRQFGNKFQSACRRAFKRRNFVAAAEDELAHKIRRQTRRRSKGHAAMADIFGVRKITPRDSKSFLSYASRVENCKD